MLYHNYIFFDTDSSAHDIPAGDLASYKKEFTSLVESNTSVLTYGYSTLGMKVKTRFMLWFQSDGVEHIQDLLNGLLHTKLGKHIKITYTLFGMIRPSVYNKNKPAATPEQEMDEKIREKYLIVYPFTKTTEWHLKTFDERKTIMIDHMKTGHKHMPIKQLLLYAYGVDDHEFIVSYETQALIDFQSLVMELRGTEGRRYTKNDLPIFTCVHHPLMKVLDVI